MAALPRGADFFRCKCDQLLRGSWLCGWSSRRFFCEIVARLARFHIGHKTIAAPCDRRDETVRAGFFAEEAAEGGDALTQIVVFHQRIRPDRRHQALFVHHATAVLDQKEYSLKKPRRELHL